MGYLDLEGWFDFEDIYRAAAAKFAGSDDVLVEVGVAYGRSLAFLAGEAIERQSAAFIIGVDAWSASWGRGDDFFGQACAGMRAHTPLELARVSLFRAGSIEAARLVAEEDIYGFTPSGAPLVARSPRRLAPAFVFIDADHSYEAVRDDIAAWRPLVRPGGWIGGHDHTGAWPGVEKAVREAFGAGGYEISGSSWLVKT